MKPLFLTAFSIFLLTVSYATSQPSLDSFIQCLQNHSDSSKPISASVYTRNNSSFSQILLTRIHNRRHSTPNTPKPLAIITATDESNVRATVICAKSHGIQLRIRSGGHDYEGMSYVSDVPFVILDMFNLNSINIDVANEIAWVDAGATTGQIYYRIAEKSTVHGFPAGAGLNLGAGGHFSGGGYGYMMRKYGLSVDNIIDARIVDVNGKILDRKTMGEDVFWAIRGGGGASFGVILSWKISLVKVPEKVTVFRINKTVEQGATDVVYQWQFVAPKLHEDLFIRVMPTVENSTQKGKKTVQVDFIGHFLGLSDRLLGLLNESFPELGLQKSDCHEVSWAESTVFWADYPVGTSIEVLLNKPTHWELVLQR
ncbi:FAD-binding Berberine family protein [Quillaja saponaria]|uniref:FAD-binding Berberine family protein n=1 Tax=Quillaja saponaria TaxID=32244 RepID=A0AAD7L335_QUISA|nr:FAD-binding Berberine family protein [Quillaja saponaria]